MIKISLPHPIIQGGTSDKNRKDYIIFNILQVIYNPLFISV